MRIWIIKFSVVVLSLFLLASAYLLWAWNHPLRPGTETYTVKPGTSLGAFARELNRRHVLLEPLSFILLAHLTRQDRALKPGEYRFRDGLSAREVLAQVAAGRVIEYPVVLLEGWTFDQFLATLAAAPKLDQTLTGLSTSAVMERLGRPLEHPEGRFFPDTYYYSAGQTDLMILSKAYDKMQRLLQREWEDREDHLPLQNPYEALILASIVEKETGRDEERRLIAGVFVNRLRLGMRLQSDPTVIYGMGKTFDGNIRLKDLKHDTPYNTYTRKGLPPTPVAMPGEDSLRAVMRPLPTAALFFVSRGDGSHVFSATLEQHNEAVRKYQLKINPRKSGASPAAKIGAAESGSSR